MRNQAGKWVSTANWELPPEGSEGFITNHSADTVLSTPIKTIITEIKATEENLALGQKWIRGTADGAGYFNIMMANTTSSKMLAASSGDKLIIEGLYLQNHLFFHDEYILTLFLQVLLFYQQTNANKKLNLLCPIAVMTQLVLYSALL